MNGKAELTLEQLKKIEFARCDEWCIGCNAEEGWGEAHGEGCWLNAAIREAERQETVEDIFSRDSLYIPKEPRDDEFARYDESAEEALSANVYDMEESVIVEIETVTRGPNIFGFFTYTKDGDEDDAYFFLTREEAEAKLAELEAAQEGKG